MVEDRVRARGWLFCAWLALGLVGCGHERAAEPDVSTETTLAADGEATTSETFGDSAVESAPPETVAETEADTETETDTDTEVASEPQAHFQVAFIESRSVALDTPFAYATAGRRYAPDRVGAEVVTRGDCAFVLPGPAPFCDPACAPGTVCGPDATCITPPAALNAGTITADGLAVALTLVPETVYAYYAAHFAPEPTDGHLFAAGATLRAQSDGGPTVGPFDLATTGAPTLATTTACPPVLADGQALIVTWTAVDPAERVQFMIESGNHGAQFARIECDAPDTGSLTVAGELVTRYLATFRPLDLWTLSRAHEATQRVGNVEVHLRAERRLDCRF